MLTVAGSAPIVVMGVAASMRFFDNTPIIVHSLLSYAAVILSFLGGIHWGMAVAHYGHNKRVANWLITESVVPAIIAWIAVLNAPMHIQLLILTLLFTFVWGIDSILFNRNIIPQWFFEIRCIITPVVVVSLYIAYFGII